MINRDKNKNMHQLNVLNKSTSNESMKKDQNENVKENNPQLTTTASCTSIDADKSLFITSHSSIQQNRQELFHQYGASSSTDSNRKSPQHQTVSFSSEINIPNQARCSVLKVVQAKTKSQQPTTKTIKTGDFNKPFLHLNFEKNFMHSFKHPSISGSLDETANTNETNQLSSIHLTNRGSTFLSSRSPPGHHTTIQLPPTSPFNQQQSTFFNQTSPSYRTINLNTLQTSGLSANDIYRGRRCFKRSISLASAQSHHHLSQQMSLTQPFAAGHRRTNPLLGDYGRRRAYLDSFE